MSYTLPFKTFCRDDGISGGGEDADRIIAAINEGFNEVTSGLTAIKDEVVINGSRLENIETILQEGLISTVPLSPTKPQLQQTGTPYLKKLIEYHNELSGEDNNLWKINKHTYDLYLLMIEMQAEMKKSFFPSSNSSNDPYTQLTLVEIEKIVAAVTLLQSEMLKANFPLGDSEEVPFADNVTHRENMLAIVTSLEQVMLKAFFPGSSTANASFMENTSISNALIQTECTLIKAAVGLLHIDMLKANFIGGSSENNSFVEDISVSNATLHAINTECALIKDAINSLIALTTLTNTRVSEVVTSTGETTAVCNEQLRLIDGKLEWLNQNFITHLNVMMDLKSLSTAGNATMVRVENETSAVNTALGNMLDANISFFSDVVPKLFEIVTLITLSNTKIDEVVTSTGGTTTVCDQQLTSMNTKISQMLVENQKAHFYNGNPEDLSYLEHTSTLLQAAEEDRRHAHFFNNDPQQPSYLQDISTLLNIEFPPAPAPGPIAMDDDDDDSTIPICIFIAR